MDTWDAYRSRRNIRDYADRPIADAVLDWILDAGRRAPSAFNSEPWDFVVVAGHPASGPLTPTGGLDRRALADVVHHGRW